MAKQIQSRRGTTAEHAGFTGALGEVTVDTTKKVVVVHDGTTAGGIPGARQADITAANAAITVLQANTALLRSDLDALDPSGATSSITQLRANITAANVQIANLNSNASVQATLIGNLQTNLNGANGAIQTVAIRTGVVENNIIALQAVDTAINAAIVSLETVVYGNASGQATAISALQANVSAANAAILVNTNRVAAANVEIAALRANISAANASVVAANNSVSAANIEISALRSNITAANTAIGTVTSEWTANAAAQAISINTVNANVSAANAAIVSVQANVTAANAEITSIRTVVRANGNVTTSAMFASGNITAGNIAAGQLNVTAVIGTFVGAANLFSIGDTTTLGNLSVAGNISIAATTGTPVSNVAPVSWLKVTVGGSAYYMPLYQ